MGPFWDQKRNYPKLSDERGPWRTVDEVKYATLEWVDWFNNRRLMKLVGNIPSAELEMAYYRHLEESAMAA
tara:strand:- start:5187 stop:5399 length:213 start_codon:yes stop_codon:yes gene_type:complete